MQTTFTKTGFKTIEVVQKSYEIKYINKLMTAEQWIKVTSSLYGKDNYRMECGLCEKRWENMQKSARVNLVIFKKVHVNKIICDNCRTKISEAMEKK